MFQSYHLLPFLTVRQNVELPYLYSEQNLQLVEFLLESVLKAFQVTETLELIVRAKVHHREYDDSVLKDARFAVPKPL